MRALRASWRAARVLLHVLRGLWILKTSFPRLNATERDAVVQRWSAGFLRLLGVQPVVLGEAVSRGPALMVANHVSWLDIMVLNAARPARFVSKSDVRRWPLVGALCEGAGTLFIEREKRRDAMRVVHQLADRLRAGEVTAVFPEGTTGDGRHLLPFHANLLQAAIVVDAPIQPVVLGYFEAQSSRRCDAALFVGDTPFLVSLWRTLNMPAQRAVVHYAPLQEAWGRDRRTWSLALRTEMEGRLLNLRPPAS